MMMITSVCYNVENVWETVEAGRFVAQFFTCAFTSRPLL